MIRQGATTVQAASAACTAGAFSGTTSVALAAGSYTAQASQTDAAGNTGTSSLNAFTIDTTAPTVTGVSSTLANGSYGAGQIVPITVTFSEPVNVTGTPQLTIATGSPATTTLSYASGSGTSTLTFNYTVAGGNTSPDLDYSSANALILNSGTIRDAAINNASLTLAAPGSSGSLGYTKDIVIDTGAPTVTVTTPTGGNHGRDADGDRNRGQRRR